MVGFVMCVMQRLVNPTKDYLHNSSYSAFPGTLRAMGHILAARQTAGYLDCTFAWLTKAEDRAECTNSTESWAKRKCVRFTRQVFAPEQGSKLPSA